MFNDIPSHPHKYSAMSDHGLETPLISPMHVWSTVCAKATAKIGFIFAKFLCPVQDASKKILVNTTCQA